MQTREYHTAAVAALKLNKLDPSLKMGRNKVYKAMRDNGLVCRDIVEATRRGLEQHLVKEELQWGNKFSTTKILISDAGIMYLYNRIKR